MIEIADNYKCQDLSSRKKVGRSLLHFIECFIWREIETFY